VVPHTQTAMVLAGAFTSLALFAGCVHSPKLMVPACTNPVPITGHFDRQAPEFWTSIADRQLAADVARDYGLKLTFEGSTVLTFPATIDPELLAKMRCDNRIQFLSYSEYMKNVLADNSRAHLTPRSSGRVIDKVPSSYAGVRAAQLNRYTAKATSPTELDARRWRCGAFETSKQRVSS
jgi:hypothetical protein